MSDEADGENQIFCWMQTTPATWAESIASAFSELDTLIYLFFVGGKILEKGESDISGAQNDIEGLCYEDLG